MMPLERQPSDDFVLHTPEGRTLYSNNDTTNNHFVLLPSPNSKRRELRASKELTEADRAALSSLGSSDVNDSQQATADFVLLHASPKSKRTEIRGSKEPVSYTHLTLPTKA